MTRLARMAEASLAYFYGLCNVSSHQPAYPKPRVPHFRQVHYLLSNLARGAYYGLDPNVSLGARFHDRGAFSINSKLFANQGQPTHQWATSAFLASEHASNLQYWAC
ncbi:hypothetical protein HGRIS_005549 [Hohenbuehelia grisea]|uniref:Uncharacterized protein n=1 Tax=Hohenbuehelia grisea TaxID=104357 RepID=A0ABR3JXD4_9AGAR